MHGPAAQSHVESNMSHDKQLSKSEHSVSRGAVPQVERTPAAGLACPGTRAAARPPTRNLPASQSTSRGADQILQPLTIRL